MDRTDLRPYQSRAVEFLKQTPNAGLFMDMGLGKTVTTLTAIADLFRTRDVTRVLVVGPIRVIETVWAQEAANWSQTRGLVFSMVRGDPAKRLKALETPAHIYLINPENLVWLLEHIAETGAQNPFDMLVIDESSKFKATNTKRFRALRRAVKTFKRRVLLTGTPSPNSLLDLWPQMFIMDGGKRLDTSFTRFRTTFFQQVDRFGYKWAPKPHASARISDAISDVTLRLSAADWLDLPELVKNTVRVELPADVARVYRRMETEMSVTLSDVKVTAQTVAASLAKCQQIANGALYLPHVDPANPPPGPAEWEALHTAKLDAVEEIVEETGEPVIIAYHYQHDLARLRERFPDAPVIGAGGGNVSDVVASWNRGEHRVMLVHPASAGHGLNLQHGGRHIVFFSLTWSLENHDQVIERIGPARRAGKKEPTVVHYIIAEDTVDEAIMANLSSKSKGQNALLAALRDYTAKKVPA